MIAEYALRQKLVAIIETLPEAELRMLAPVIEATQQQRRSIMQDALQRADALYAQISAEVETMPDVVDLLNEAREERLNDILGLR